MRGSCRRSILFLSSHSLSSSYSRLLSLISCSRQTHSTVSLRSTNAKEADVSEAEGSLRTGEEASGSRQKVAEIQQGHTNKIQFVGCQNVNDYLLSQVDEEPTPTIPRIPTKEQVRVVVHLLSLLPLLSYPSRSRDAMRDVSPTAFRFTVLHSDCWRK